MPITNGVRPTDRLQEVAGRAVQLAGVQHVPAEQPGQRQVDLADVRSAGRVAQAAHAVEGLGVEAEQRRRPASSAQSARLRSTYGPRTGASGLRDMVGH